MTVVGYTKADIDSLLAGYLRVVVWNGTGSQPARPVTAAGQAVVWFCPTQPAVGGTVTSQTTAVAALDIFIRTP